MADRPGRQEPALARTDFESMTHEQLAALIDSASSQGAAHLATKLSKASSTITKIGDDLMTYTKGLEWQGEGGDAFRDWGGQSAAATLRLGQYAEVASRWMATVAQAVAEAKAAMPATSETTQAKADLADARKTIAATQDPGARNDPDARKLAQTAQSDATAAQQRMEAARAEAVQQLRKLAQTYEYSAQQVNSVPPPTFSPPARHVDGPWESSAEYVPVGADSTYRQPASTSSSVSGHSSVASHTDQPVSRIPSGAATPLVDEARSTGARPAAMEIDSLASLPTTAPVGPAGVPVGPPRPEGSVSPQTGLFAPPVTGMGNGTTRSVATPSSPVSRPPLLPSQGTPSANGGIVRPPRETGIVGGRPVSAAPGRPSGPIPQGTVIGGGNASAGSHMVRGVGAGAMGGGGFLPGQTGGVVGRRLASETGGMVGNRPIQGGVAARPFTPGGSGLVRPSNSTSSSPHAAAPTGRTTPPRTPSSASRDDERRGDRPDYLTEEEETWVSGSRRGLPPVIN
ncbi:hypothetical protein GCM10010261_42870 [Streptomyces pilosus]|uniref:hypothetical protein n=1 Tax=Streptomyces pilosus TaxID=28893 RepID=UPI001677350B|nr:hypothetical protein [Streptomyces pilosus]GGV57272.1 hypothetical protein GCM10010261_42870 [Streptomyces pilosus]